MPKAANCNLLKDPLDPHYDANVARWISFNVRNFDDLSPHWVMTKKNLEKRSLFL